LNRPAPVRVPARACELIHKLEDVFCAVDGTALTHEDLRTVAEYLEAKTRAFNRRAFHRLAADVAEKRKLPG